MTEQEFLEIVSLHVETHYKEEGTWGETKYQLRSGKKLNEINLDDIIYVKWLTGGVGGGTYKNNNHYELKAEPTPEFKELDTLLDVICPNITLRQYKLLLDGVSPSLVEVEEWEVYEHYGNFSYYKCKKISLRRLHERLQGLGLL